MKTGSFLPCHHCPHPLVPMSPCLAPLLSAHRWFNSCTLVVLCCLSLLLSFPGTSSPHLFKTKKKPLTGKSCISLYPLKS